MERCDLRLVYFGVAAWPTQREKSSINAPSDEWVLCVFQEGGVRALYRGFLPTLCGMVPYAGLSFYCFERLKFLCMKYIPDASCNQCNRNTGMPFLLFSVLGDIALLSF